ncbi:MAG: ABC transporter ATP-binding protein [Deltaproteobacteria bacterium]|nr:ABC transporter ATP-binding protein [Deltaproteobacteria bacterium]
MIEVKNVTKYYGQVCALNNVSFDVKKGEIVGLLGPNGSGKTTLMRILTGFFPPTEGKVSVAGIDVEMDSLGARSRLGYLPESVVLYPDMTVRSFLNFCVRVKGNSAEMRQSQVDRVLQQCSLEHMAHRHIGTLSKGYRQRVGLAQALLCDPEVLILDEPTVGLDPNQVIEMRDLISGMAGKRTILLSSHILHEVGLTCQRVVIIDKGNIIAEDTAAGLSDRIQGATRTNIRVAGPQAEIISALRALPGVKDVIEQESTEKGQEGHSFIVTSPDRTTTREIAQAIVTRGWALYEMTPMTLGLEELFVRLTAPTDQRKEAA